MTVVSMVAEAGVNILQRLQSGELEMYGIMLRDSKTKQIRYFLRGAERLAQEFSQGGDPPKLPALQGAISLSQVMAAAEIASKLTTAISLRRIEAKLDGIERKLGGIEKHLVEIGHGVDLTRLAIQAAAVSRLKAAKTAAVVAIAKGNRPALLACAKDAEHSARDLIAFASHLIRQEEDGIPLALRVPNDFCNLVESASAAMGAAAAMYVNLENGEIAARLMNEVAGDVVGFRQRLRHALRDPELTIRRIQVHLADDAAIAEAGLRLRAEEQWISACAIKLNRQSEAQSLEQEWDGPDFIGFEEWESQS